MKPCPDCREPVAMRTHGSDRDWDGIDCENSCHPAAQKVVEAAERVCLDYRRLDRLGSAEQYEQELLGAMTALESACKPLK